MLGLEPGDRATVAKAKERSPNAMPALTRLRNGVLSRDLLNRDLTNAIDKGNPAIPKSACRGDNGEPAET